MRRKRIYSLLLALALAAGLLTGCGQENTAQESTADKALPTLVVGVDTFRSSRSKKQRSFWTSADCSTCRSSF